MIINKYTWWRKGIYFVQRIFPPAKRLKNLSPRFKFKKYLRRMAARQAVIDESLASSGRYPLFKRVEIETINRCNGECSFCPVNKHLDPRKTIRMTDQLFESILSQLAELRFTGEVCLYSNNEPFLDDRIIRFAESARRKLPDARIILSTNGTLLDTDKFLAIIDSLDTLIIDNYCDDFTFRPNVREIIRICEEAPHLDGKTRITMRYVNEVMTSRGGLSPNKKKIAKKTLPFGCMSPTQQLIIRPDGKLSLCCNDALGKVTVGDLTADTLENIWFGAKAAKLKRSVMESRTVFDICRHCDTMNS